MTEIVAKCRGCAGEAIMLCLCDSQRLRFCKSCLSNHLTSSTDRTHTLLPMQAFPFVQTRQEEKNFFARMEKIDDLIIKISQRLDRLVFTKEKALLEIQLAAEELKRLVDKQLEKRSEELRIECEKHEFQLKSLKNSLSDVRYAKNYEEDSLIEKLITDKSVSDQLMLEPLNFQLVTNPILNFLPEMVSFYFRELGDTKEKAES